MREESKALLKADPQGNPSLIIGAIKELQEFEKDEYARLDSIRKTIQDGKPVSKYEILHVSAMYEKLQHEVEYQRKVDWTLDAIKRLQESKLGNFEKLNAIKHKLEEEKTLDEEETSYIKENYKRLRIIVQ